MSLFCHFSQRDAAIFILIICVFYSLAVFYVFPSATILFNPSVQPLVCPTKFSTAGIQSGLDLPETQVIAHAPGWTLFRNLYMANGTLFILSSNGTYNYPEVRKMISVSIPAINSPENIAAREPTPHEMSFLKPDEARSLWGGVSGVRVSSVEGNTLLYSDPSQFLGHYYHFVAELLLGTRAFLHGAFSQSFTRVSPHIQYPLQSDVEQSSFNRAIFMYSDTRGWRDDPGFNAYFLRAAFPSITVEVMDDWQDRIDATSENNRAWHFPMALLADRSASFRGDACGGRNSRTAAEAWEYMVSHGALDLFGKWWSDVRTSVTRFAGANVDAEEAKASRIVYISRQGGRRRLIQEDHDRLVDELTDLVARKRAQNKSWILDVVEAQHLSKDEQVKLFSDATILLGVHGNGLTHLLLMSPQPTSTVIEIFYPGGFAHDYEWTTRALGMRHYGVWNDTHFTYPDEPVVAYPEGFQGESIPVYAPNVVKLIESRLEA